MLREKPKDGKQLNLRVREHPKQGPYVQGTEQMIYINNYYYIEVSTCVYVLLYPTIIIKSRLVSCFRVESGLVSDGPLKITFVCDIHVVTIKKKKLIKGLLVLSLDLCHALVLSPGMCHAYLCMDQYLLVYGPVPTCV